MNGTATRERRPLVQPDPIEVPQFGADGAESGTISFRSGAVRNYPNIPLLKEAVRYYLGRKRRGTASTKERGEIKGSPAKPWRQKGTGRARQGSRKSPIWRGGGVVFGPKPRTYDYGLPRKQRRIATRHALLSKLLDGETRVVTGLEVDAPKTRNFGRLLKTIGIAESCLIGVASNLDHDARRRVVQAARNLHNVQVLPVCDFNAHSLLKHRSLVLTSEALAEIQASEDKIGGAE